MATTTHTAILNQWETVINALTPTTRPDVLFMRCIRTKDLIAWADTSPTSAISRKWQMHRQDREVVPFYHPEQREVRQSFLLTVAYFEAAFRGSQGRDDVEDVLVEDAAKIYDALFSPDNYLSGQCMTQINILSPERGLDSSAWLQRFEISTTYYEAQSL